MIRPARGDRSQVCDPTPRAVAVQRFEENKNLAFYAVNRWFPLLPAADKGDAESVAMIGLWKACRYFRPALGFTFGTYAIRCIQNEFKRSGMWKGEQRRQGTGYGDATHRGESDAPRLVSMEAMAGDDITVGELLSDASSDPLAVLLHREALDEARDRYESLFPSIKVRCRAWGEELAALYGTEPPPLDKRSKAGRLCTA